MFFFLYFHYNSNRVRAWQFWWSPLWRIRKQVHQNEVLHGCASTGMFQFISRNVDLLFLMTDPWLLHQIGYPFIITTAGKNVNCISRQIGRFWRWFWFQRYRKVSAAFHCHWILITLDTCIHILQSAEITLSRAYRMFLSDCFVVFLAYWLSLWRIWPFVGQDTL